jgi:hypothetical protein
MTTPFSELAYDSPAYDLVRYRDDNLDDQLGRIIFDLASNGDPEAIRRTLTEDDAALITLYAHRRIVVGRRKRSSTPLLEALDAYALLATLSEGEINSWLKALLYFGREYGMDFDAVADRFRQLSPDSAENVVVVISALDRLEHLAQCHIVETSTNYGVGLLNTVIVRERASAMGLGGVLGIPVKIGSYEVAYDLASRVANVGAALADAFDAIDGLQASEIRHDQLVASTFDVVASGSYLTSRACVNFYVSDPEGLTFTVKVADLDPDEDEYSAEDLAEMADELVDQAAVASGSYLVVLSVVPDFDDMFADEPFDGEDEGDDEELDEDPLGIYLDTVRRVLSENLPG